MSFKYDYDDIRNMMVQSGTSVSDWNENLGNMINSIQGFVDSEEFTGGWADSVKSYMSEIHITSMSAILQMLADFNVKVLMFAYGAYQYETFESAKIPEERISAGETLLDGLYTKYEELHTNVTTLVDEISGIVDVTMPSIEPVLSRITEIKTELTTHKTGLYDYDQQWAKDLSDLETFISTTKTVVYEIYNNKGKNITGYEGGSFYQLDSVLDMADSWEVSCDYMEENADKINLAASHQGSMAERAAEREAAEARAEYGAVLIIGGLCVIGLGVYVICATGGTAMPAVLATVKDVLAISTIAYGTSNAIEGVGEVYLGATGDGSSTAFNPIRDTIFAGNQEAYNNWGEIVVTGCTFSYQ